MHRPTGQHSSCYTGVQKSNKHLKRVKARKILSKNQDLVPRPKGHSGHAGGDMGYSVIEEMHLSDKKEVFNYLKVHPCSVYFTHLADESSVVFGLLPINIWISPKACGIKQINWLLRSSLYRYVIAAYSAYMYTTSP